jgi:replicative DNA helicase
MIGGTRPAASFALNATPDTKERQSLYSEEAERGVLGAILLDSARTLDFCLEKQIEIESFYFQHHQHIYQTMLELHQANKPVDVLTLAEKLRLKGQLEQIGDVAYLEKLLDATPTLAYTEYYIDILWQYHLKRRIVECARIAENDCYNPDYEAEDVLARVEQSFFEVSESKHDGIPSWPQSIKETIKILERIHSTGKGISGIPTGYPDLDEKLLGFHPQEMIVLAARPSMGKTSLALNIVENIALGRVADKTQRPIGMFSLEMSREDIILRLLSSHSKIPSHAIAGGYISSAQHQKIINAADLFSKAYIYLDDTGGLEITELRARARRMRKKYGVELIVVDYLQLLHSREHRREGRQQEVSAVSGALKNMAKELKIPVLVISQLNRSPEAKDRDGRPRLADLRDSGSIEQDADVVLLLYRPGKYSEDSAERDEATTKLDIAKQRNGPTGEIDLVFLSDIMHFEPAAKQQEIS